MAERLGRRCTMPGCDGRYEARGFCKKHYQRWLTYGDPTRMLINRYAPGTTCAAPDCARPVKARGLCDAHYWRQHRTGDVGTAAIGERPCNNPLPLDLAAEAVRRVRLGESRRKVAAALGISPSAVWTFARGLRRTGALAGVAQEAQ